MDCNRDMWYTGHCARKARRRTRSASETGAPNLYYVARGLPKGGSTMTISLTELRDLARANSFHKAGDALNSLITLEDAAWKQHLTLTSILVSADITEALENIAVWERERTYNEGEYVWVQKRTKGVEVARIKEPTADDHYSVQVIGSVTDWIVSCEDIIARVNPLLDQGGWVGDERWSDPVHDTPVDFPESIHQRPAGVPANAVQCDWCDVWIARADVKERNDLPICAECFALAPEPVCSRCGGTDRVLPDYLNAGVMKCISCFDKDLNEIFEKVAVSPRAEPKVKHDTLLPRMMQCVSYGECGTDAASKCAHHAPHSYSETCETDLCFDAPYGDAYCTEVSND